jgi:hypothetical protein
MTDLSTYNAELAWFRQTVSKLPTVTPESIRGLVTSSPFDLSDDVGEAISRHLEAVFDVRQDLGASVRRKDFRPWLRGRKTEIEFYYWSRLQRYLLELGKLPPAVVGTLDSVTDEILDYAGDPAETGIWRRRGMVLGHVQSGKTSNYSALICKAADAGFKITILLAGTTNLLRAQTQERIDEAFIGREAIFGVPGIARLIGVSHFIKEGEETRTPFYGTSVDSDFSVVNARNYGVTLEGINEPIIFVTKKNPTTLKNLRNWLTERYPLGNISHPLLLIDDEADNASINTSADPDKATKINGQIREILALFRCSSYVGYTATPFANIFIDPATNDEMLESDLFPADYIKSLDPPTNYVGPGRVFGPAGDLGIHMVKEVDDYRDILPLNHKNHHPVTDLPPSLLEAVRVFLLTRCIRILRGDGADHSTMMINVSRFNSVQEAVLGEVYRYIETCKQAINVHAGLGKSGLNDVHLRNIFGDFDREFSDSEFSWPEVQVKLPDAAATVQARTVNMRGGVLDYKRNSDAGLHVIAVGGLSLSRGLTLEGLTVSYFLRNASAYDTLMQMARWFGYRPDYEDLCRLYITEGSRDYYEHISEVTEELRSELGRMEQLGMTPRDFGLKVREHPDAIRITAANKMRTAQRITLASDLSLKHVEGHSLFNDDDRNTENRNFISEFLRSLGNPHNPYNLRPQEELFWHAIDVAEVLELFGQLKLPEANFELGPNFRVNVSGDARSLLQDYISDRRSSELRKWDVVVSQTGTVEKAVETEILPGTEIRCRRRQSGTGGNIYRVTGSRQRVADRLDAAFGLRKEDVAEVSGGSDRDYNRQRTMPLLLVHIFEAGVRDGEQPLKFKSNCVSVSVCLPGTEVAAAERQYQANPVWIQQMESVREEDEDVAELD